MSPKSVLSVHAPIAIGFAIPLAFAPTDFLWLYGADVDLLGRYLARLLAAALAATASIAWLAREAPEGAALDAICAGFAIGMGIALFASIHHQLTSPDVTALGWTTVITCAGLFAAYTGLWLGREGRRVPVTLQAG